MAFGRWPWAFLAVSLVACGGNVVADGNANAGGHAGSAGAAATGGGSGSGASGGAGEDASTDGAPAGGSGGGDAGCDEGATQSEPCGIKGNGKQPSQCVAGAWVKVGECVDPDIITALAAGSKFTCALRQDGRVACWGMNDRGQLGSPKADYIPVATNVPGVSGAVAIAAGDAHACAVRGDGAVICWGANSHGQTGNGGTQLSAPAVPTAIQDAVGVGAGDQHTCAVHKNGTVTCWGYGQLGDGATTASSTGVTVAGLVDATSVTAGYAFTCAVRQTGKIVCWGLNSMGQLGAGSLSYSSSTPVEVLGIHDAVAVDASNNHACALRKTGQVMCWGNNDAGQLGNTGAGTNSTAPVPVADITDVGDVQVASGRSCALRKNGQLWCWGAHIVDFGHSAVPTLVTGVADAVDFSLGEAACVLRNAGGVECWGSNRFGALGIGTSNVSLSPVAVVGLSKGSSLAAGSTHACATNDDGTAACWGFNFYGQLGNGTTLSAAAPVALPGLVDAVDVSTLDGHSCAVRANGGVACWGDNTNGQLGDGTLLTAWSPVSVLVLSDAIDVRAGHRHSCALRSNGAVVCWGANDFGQLGNSSAPHPSTTPVSVGDVTDAVSLSVGGSHACALRKTGKVACWGSASNAQLGSFPVKNGQAAEVPGLSDVKSVVAGGNRTCAIRADDTVVCWGFVYSDELEGGSPSTSLSPLLVPGLTKVVALAAGGGGHACAVRESGSVACWGPNFSGQLGTDAVSESVTPIEIKGITDAVDAAIGGQFACARRKNGAVACWGSGEHGELGDDQAFSREPRPIVWPPKD